MFRRCLCLVVMAFGFPLFSSAVAAAEEFTVKLVRPHKVGEEYKTEIGFSHKSTGAWTTTYTGVLIGTIKVLAVNEKTGGITHLTCVVERFERDRRPLFPPGTVIEGSRVDHTVSLSINGRAADQVETALLRPMLPMEDPNVTVSDDDSGGTKTMKPVGTAWPVNSALMAKGLQEGGVPVSADSVKGESRIVRVETMKGTKTMMVQTAVNVTAIQPHAAANNMAVLGGIASIEQESVLPIDISLPVISTSTRTRLSENFSTRRGNLTITTDNFLKHTDTPK